MPIIRGIVTLGRDSALPEDQVVNVFHFDASGPTGGQLDDIADHLITFYKDVNTTPARSVASFLSSDLSGSIVVKLYNLSDTVPRAPVLEVATTMTVGTGQSLPAEVALCLSFQGAPLSGQPQARRRGRVYIGPLDIECLTTDPVGRPVQEFMDTLGASADRMQTDSNASSTPWGVLSVTDNQLVEIVDGWVDNAFDTQRRRGEAATVRNVWPAA